MASPKRHPNVRTNPSQADVAPAVPPPAAPARATAPVRLLARPALFEQLLEALREMIVNGDVVEGTRLNEPDLCERFGISRTPLREAFKVLASEGLVEMQTFRGAFVASISEEEARQVSFVLSALEQAAATLLVERIVDTDVRWLKEATARMLQAAAAGDLQTYRSINEGIHQFIVDGAGNPVLTESYNRIKNRLRRPRHAKTKTSQEFSKAAREHMAILNAVVRRDANRLAAIIQRHYGDAFHD
jgi:DNA-binding GntR family transcriptional regulator